MKYSLYRNEQIGEWDSPPYFRRASISDGLTSQRRMVGSLAFLADLIRRLKTREQAERMILCACRFLPPSHTSVMSNRSDSALRSAKEEVTLVWKSFHLRQNESSGEALPMMKLKLGEALKRRKFGSAVMLLLSEGCITDYFFFIHSFDHEFATACRLAAIESH